MILMVKTAEKTAYIVVAAALDTLFFQNSLGVCSCLELMHAFLQGMNVVAQ